MALFARSRRTSNVVGPVFDGDIPPRPVMTQANLPRINTDTALKHSAVWACVRLRADLVSSFPCDVYRKVQGVQFEVPKPMVLQAPGGENWSYMQWMWATQSDLDRCGNTVGIIKAKDGGGRPALIELAATSDVVIRQLKTGEVKYKIGRDEFDAEDIWHERQFTASGMVVGLSPVAYAASSLMEYASMQQFAIDWFTNMGVPRGRLVHKTKRLDTKEARIMKDRYRATVNNGDLFVHGEDWDFHLLAAEQAGVEFIEGRKHGVADAARYFGAPLDLIEAAVQAGGNINYANVTQRHLQFLILHLDPAVKRREEAMSRRLLAAPRYVKLNRDSLLAMDPLQRAQYLGLMVKYRLMTNPEAREKDDRPPLTQADIDEFEKIYGPPGGVQPDQPGSSNSNSDGGGNPADSAVDKVG